MSINRWLGPDAGARTAIPRWIWWLLGVTAALGAISFVYYQVLHARVRSITAEMRKMNEALVDEIAMRIRTEEELKEHQQHLEEIVEDRTRELGESEKKYRLLANNVSDTIWTLDLEENFTYLSPSVGRLAGYTPEEAARMTLSKLLTPASLATSRQRLAERMASGNFEETLLFELELVRKDGSTFPAEVSSTPTADDQGNITGFLGITRDITQRKEAEKALRDSEKRLRLALEASNTGLWDMNVRTGDFYVSPNFFTRLGYQPEEHPKTGEQLRQLVHEDDLPRLGVELDEHLKRGEHYKQEIRFQNKRGQWQWFIESGSVIEWDENDEPLRMVGTAVDITDLKRAEQALRDSEERYRSIVENSTLGIFRTTPEGRVTTANPALAKIMGYDSPQEIIDTIGDLAEQVYQDPGDRKRVLQMMQEKGKAITELNFRRKDGQKIIVGINMWMVSDEKGQLRYLEGFLEDVTEKRANEETLKLYRRIFMETSDGILVTEPDGKVIDFNPASFRQSGYSAEEMRGQDIAKLIYKEDSEKIGRDLQQNGIYRGETRVQHRDGSSTYIDLSVFPITHEDGGVICHVGMGRDITERKKAEEALRRERDKAQRYLDIAGVIIVAIEADQKVALVNRRGAEVLGVAEENIVGKNWFDNYVPERNRVDVKAAFTKLMAGEVEPVEYFENKIQTNDGEERLIAWHNTALRDEEGSITGTLSSGEDITERKQAAEALRESEEKFRVMSAAAHDAIVMIDNDGNVTYWNKAAEKIFGYSSGEMRGKNLHDILAPPRYHQAYREGFRRFKTTGKGDAVGRTLELEALRKHSTEVSVELSMSSVKLMGLWSAIGIIRDITERKQAEEAIRQANDKLQRAFDELKATQIQLVQTEKMASMGRLVAGVAHELNNPIGAVISSSRNLRSGLMKFEAICGEAKEETCEYQPQMQKVLAAMKSSHQVIDEGSQRVARIVKRLKAFVRLDEAELQLGDIHQSIEEALQLLPTGWDKRVTLVRSYGQLPEFTYFPARMNEALNNVFINAVEAIKEKGKMEITTRVADGSAVITIEDNGVGMSPEVREHIFDPGMTTKSRGVGTGLGMAISFQIMRDHQGSITVESELGKGTTVTLAMPLDLER
jgi:PAS domain S-box-containing protein